MLIQQRIHIAPHYIIFTLNKILWYHHQAMGKVLLAGAIVAVSLSYYLNPEPQTRDSHLYPCP